MAKPGTDYDTLIQPTPKGVKVEFSTIYIYPDGHANVTFKDGANWPLATPYEVFGELAGLLGRMYERAKGKAKK